MRTDSETLEKLVVAADFPDVVAHGCRGQSHNRQEAGTGHKHQIGLFGTASGMTPCVAALLARKMTCSMQNIAVFNVIVIAADTVLARDHAIGRLR